MQNLGDYGEARAWAQRCLDAAREADLPWFAAWSRVHLGALAITTGAYSEAQRNSWHALGHFREVGHLRSQSWALSQLGLADRGLGRSEQARQHLRDALQITGSAAQFWEPLLLALAAVTLLLADAGQAERAVERDALASRYAYVANSRWFEDVIGHHIAAVAATLPPHVVAAAQELLEELGQSDAEE